MRSPRLLLRSLPVSLSLLALAVTPALAAEESGSSGTDWTGLILAAIAGLIIGVIVFVTVGGRAEPDHHGAEAVHGDDGMAADPDQAASDSVSAQAPE